MKSKRFINRSIAWEHNKPFIWFFLALLLMHSVLKIIFYQYNHQLLFNGTGSSITGYEQLRLLKWSLLLDAGVLLGINVVLLIMLWAGRFVHQKISTWLIIPLFILLNSFALLLNLADIFYFRFHFQRANADLLYVIDHPLNRLMQQRIPILLLMLTAILVVLFLVWMLHKKLYRSFAKGDYGTMILMVLVPGMIIALVSGKSFTRYLVPTSPMVELKSSRLPFVQNSFHTFLYSVFRKGENFRPQQYMTGQACDSLFPIRKKLVINNSKKNIVLFIMESVPYDFFDSTGPYKVAMPFFDSILTRSSFFTNAFAYSHESNKGITAILAGIPTLGDIPVYHSPYVNMPVTAVGTALKGLHYRSIFCIGDEYDNFGFAKCMNWLGFDRYYSKEDIPGYQKLPAHSMGLQDEYVLDFFRQKIAEQQVPFFAVHYNISTHYPYDIPASFSAGAPKNYTDPMKSMQYYDHSLRKFFSAAVKEPWYANTLFIFCSDHWLVPDDKRIQFNAITGYRIPVIIHDASVNEKKIITQPVGQFDILGTVLAAAGYTDSITSYGNNLLDSASITGRVITKRSSTVYQLTDSSYVFGFNIISQKPEYLYHYRNDPLLKKDLVTDKHAAWVLGELTTMMKAFLQKAGTQYSGRPFK